MMNDSILSLTSAGAVSYPIQETAEIVRAGDNLTAQTTSEQILRIANRLLNSLKSGERLIACTGFRQTDHSSSFALHAGIATVRMGHGPVLVIDADFARRKDYASDGPVSQGLADALRGECEDVEAIRHTSIEGLDVVAIGSRPQQSPALLTSARLQSLLDTFRQYRVAFVDVGPVLKSTESLMLAGRMDAVVAVGTTGELTKRELLELKSELAPLPPRFLGLVLTDSL